MSIVDNDTPSLPNWLTTTNPNAMPFRPATQKRLQEWAAKDPRIIDIIARLEAKTEAFISTHPERNYQTRDALLSACPEWQWVRRICKEPSKVLNDMHAQAGISLVDESDIISLAAYREENSLAHFFIEYANKVSLPGETPEKPPLSEAEQHDYAESIRMIYPIACDLQPQVALAYAPYVMHALDTPELKDQVISDYMEMARHYPSLILTRPEQFDSFRSSGMIMETAQKSRAARKENGEALNSIEAKAEEHLAKLEEIAGSPSPWGGSWRDKAVTNAKQMGVTAAVDM